MKDFRCRKSSQKCKICGPLKKNPLMFKRRIKVHIRVLNVFFLSYGLCLDFLQISFVIQSRLLCISNGRSEEFPHKTAPDETICFLLIFLTRRSLLKALLSRSFFPFSWKQKGCSIKDTELSDVWIRCDFLWLYPWWEFVRSKHEKIYE